MAGILGTLHAARGRRFADGRIERTLDELSQRLASIDEQVASAARRDCDADGDLGNAISSTIDLGEVLQRTLAAAGALPAVDGSQIRVRSHSGIVEAAARGLVGGDGDLVLGGPPDGKLFLSGLVNWETTDVDALRAGLVVPIATDPPGALCVYSRLSGAFDADSTAVLAAIARRAVPAVENAFRYREAQERAATDARTGVGSDSAFAEALPREIATARRHQRPLCMIQFDIDDFGEINRIPPRFHETGDEVLTDLGSRIRETVRTSDSAFRKSGGADEFILILPETTLEEARLLYNRLAFVVAAHPFADVVQVTLSAGLAELRADDTPESLGRRANQCLHVAKNSGKNRLVAEADE